MTEEAKEGETVFFGQQMAYECKKEKDSGTGVTLTPKHGASKPRSFLSVP
jgi:hypothetical protein